MRDNHLAILIAALAVAVGLLVIAGCGGGGGSKDAASRSGARKASNAVAEQTSHSSEHDCTGLSHLTTDLALADAGFDYGRDREFVDDYAERAPDEISDSVDRLRDIIDRFASAAKKAGLEPNDMPNPDQADAVKDALDYSGDDQEANGRAFQAINAWVTNGCGS
jgi:hypothetical protein